MDNFLINYITIFNFHPFKIMTYKIQWCYKNEKKVTSLLKSVNCDTYKNLFNLQLVTAKKKIRIPLNLKKKLWNQSLKILNIDFFRINNKKYILIHTHL